MNAYQLGCQDALFKFSFDEEDAEKVLRLAKEKQLPKASYKALPAALAARGMQTVPGNARKEMAAIRKDMTASGIPGTHPERKRFNKIMAPVQRIADKAGGVIVPGTSPDPVNYFSALAERPDDSQRKMLNAIAKGHELDELSVAQPSKVMAGFGHRSPDVMLREHNRVVTLPEKFQGAREFMQQARGPLEAQMLRSLAGIDYGNSPRLSRHARKRVSELLAERQTALVNPNTPLKLRKTLSERAVALSKPEHQQVVKAQMDAAAAAAKSARAAQRAAKK